MERKKNEKERGKKEKKRRLNGCDAKTNVFFPKKITSMKDANLQYTQIKKACAKNISQDFFF